jgi:hypothetical protein
MQFETNTSEWMRLTSDGKLGIGTTAPASLLDVRGATPFITITDTSVSSESGLVMDATGGFIRGGLTINYGTGEFKHYCGVASNSYFQTFLTNGSERMRISSAGNVLIGTTTDDNSKLRVVSNGSSSYSGLTIIAGTSSGNFALIVQNNPVTHNMFLVRGDGAIFTGTNTASPYNNTTGTAANLSVLADGSLARSTSSLKYKNNVENYTKGLAEVMQLRPVSYEGKNDIDNGKQFAGLIAEEVHELGLTEFVQYAEDGSPDALAYSNMVALLVKAIQELKAEIDILKNK